MKTLLIACLLAATLRAVDVSGAYENAGSMVNPGTETDAGIISFQGLLGLEFDHALTRALHAQTSRVVVTQTGTTLTIECKDLDGVTTWSGQWTKGQGYAVEPGQVNLIFRSRRFAHDGFLFSLRPAGDRQLLLVDVRRINTTWLGPVAKPLGVFLFNRASGK